MCQAPFRALGHPFITIAHGQGVGSNMVEGRVALFTKKPEIHRIITHKEWRGGHGLK